MQTSTTPVLVIPGGRFNIKEGFKRAGLKTEPAFAHYFGLDGGPYVTLLELASLDEDELRRIIRRGF